MTKPKVVLFEGTSIEYDGLLPYVRNQIRFNPEYAASLPEVQRLVISQLSNDRLEEALGGVFIWEVIKDRLINSVEDL
jgi:hypothetical protein